MSGVALVVAALPGDIQAQQVQGALSVTGGSATDVLGVTSRAVTLVPSLTILPDPRAAFTINGTATRFDNQQWAAGAGGAAALRAPLGRFAALTLNGGADATTTSYDFSYYTASALPALEATAGPLTAYVAAHGGLASTSATQQTQTPAGGLLGGNTTTSRSSVTTSRTMRGALFGANFRIPGSDGQGMIAGVREEHATIDTVPTVDRSASLTVMNGRFTIAGTAGVRHEPGANTTFGSGALSVAVHSTISVDVNAGSYPTDRLIGTRAGRYLNVGVSLRTGRRRRRIRRRPRERHPRCRDSRGWRFAMTTPHAWTSPVISRTGNRSRRIARRMACGTSISEFPRGNTATRFVSTEASGGFPEGATAIDDDLGGKSAWLVVSAPSSTTHQEDK